MDEINWKRLIDWGFRGSVRTEEEEIALGAKMKTLLVRIMGKDYGNM